MRWLSVLVLVALACSSGPRHSRSSADFDPNVARYRLKLRHNEVDPGSAFRCYSACQSQKSPQGYLSCLMECPGFEATEGIACAREEVPPVAACITARRLPPATDELHPGYVVLGVLANLAIIVAVSSACASSPNCGGYYYYPGALPIGPGPGPF